MSRLALLVAGTRPKSSESTRLPTVLSPHLRHVVARSAAGVAPRRQLSYTRGEWSKLKTLVPTSSAIHTRTPEPDHAELNPAVERIGNEEASELPAELMKFVVKLTCASTAEGGVCVVYVVGTTHGSEESCKQVRNIIRFLKPKFVFLELCKSRKGCLYPRKENTDMPSVVDINMWRETGSTPRIVYNWLASKLQVLLNLSYSEFSVAWEEVCKYRGKAILGDRPRRMWRKVPLWQFLQWRKIKVEERRLEEHELESEALYLLNLIPTLKETVLDERDTYMTKWLRKHAKSNRTLVAVVGKYHLRGIKKSWDKPILDLELEEIMSIPPEDPNGKALTCLGVAIAGIALSPFIFLLCK